MGLLDKFKKKSKTNVRMPNNVGGGEMIKKNGNLGGSIPINFNTILGAYISNKRYADAYLWLVFNKVFGGLQNVEFTIKDESALRGDAGVRIRNVMRYMQDNLAYFVYLTWQYGFVAFNNTQSGIEVVNPLNVRKNVYGRINNCDITYYSNEYEMQGSTAMKILSENIQALNDEKNAEIYLTNSLGAFGIVSGMQSPLSPKEKQDLIEMMKKEVGITSDKIQLMFTMNEVKFQQIDFKIKELELTEKIREEIKLIAGYFNVPYDLIPFSGQSTFANQKEAKIQFYESCIGNLATMGLQIIRQVVKMSPLLIPSTAFGYHIVNVPELKEDRTARIDYLSKVADVASKASGLGCNIEEYKRELERFNKEN